MVKNSRTLIQGYIIELMRHAFNDYCGARACYLSQCLNPMFVLAAQSIEKKLKSLLLTIKPNYGIKKLKKINHDLCSLTKEIKEKLESEKNNDIGKHWQAWCQSWLKKKYIISDDTQTYKLTSNEIDIINCLLDDNYDFFKKLKESYNYFRYPYQYYKAHELWSSSEVEYLDWFWCEVTYIFPLPILVKPELPLINAISYHSNTPCVQIIQTNNNYIQTYINHLQRVLTRRENYKKDVS